MVNITTIKVGCGYVYVSWIIENSNICNISGGVASLLNFEGGGTSIGTVNNYVNFTDVPSETLLKLTVYVTNANIIFVPGSPSSPTVVVRTMYMQSKYRLL